MDWIWVIGVVVAMIVAALLWWLFSRNSRSTGTEALTHAPTSPTDGRAEAGDTARPRADLGDRQEHVADAMYEEEGRDSADDEELLVEETMPESPGASGTTTARSGGAGEPPPAEVEDAAAEHSPVTGEPLYDESEWLGYAGESVIEPSVAAENGDGPDRRRG